MLTLARRYPMVSMVLLAVVWLSTLSFVWSVTS